MRQSLEITPSDIDTARERVAQEALAQTGILDLSNLRLAALPEELSGLQHLEILDCSRMQVSDLSPLAGLASLQVLNCWGAQVSDLSPLAGLASLRVLECQATQVSDLSPLAGLASLQRLKLNDCILRTIPEGFWHAPALETLYLHKTRIPGIPAEVLSQSDSDNCLDSLRAYLRALEGGFVQNTDAKLLILGNGRIGKTQICRRLRKEEYDPNVMSTHGILVRSASLLQPEDGSSMRLHLWDFGGQDIYHGTHALFMRTRAIFMLVWIPESEEAQEYTHEGLIFRNHSLDYWLSYVRHLGGLDNPILVMQTRCDRPEDETRHPPSRRMRWKVSVSASCCNTAAFEIAAAPPWTKPCARRRRGCGKNREAF